MLLLSCFPSKTISSTSKIDYEIALNKFGLVISFTKYWQTYSNIKLLNSPVVMNIFLYLAEPTDFIISANRHTPNFIFSCEKYVTPE